MIICSPVQQDVQVYFFVSGQHANVGKHTQSVKTTDNLPGKLACMDTPKYPASPSHGDTTINQTTGNNVEKCQTLQR